MSSSTTNSVIIEPHWNLKKKAGSNTSQGRGNNRTTLESKGGKRAGDDSGRKVIIEPHWNLKSHLPASEFLRKW